jgi:hypothetical protein
MVAVTGSWDFVLLDRTPDWLPWLRYVVLVAGVVVAIGLMIGVRRAARSTVLVLLVSVLTGVAGSAAYAVDTASQPHTGSIPTSGPSDSSSSFGGGRGGPGGDDATGSALTNLLKSSNTTWAAAVVSANSAAPLELASGKAVMAIGGFTGSDPSPTLAQFEQYVKEGKIHYFVVGGGPGGGGGLRGGNGGFTPGDAQGGAPGGSFRGGGVPGGGSGQVPGFGGGQGTGEMPGGGRFPGGGSGGGFGGGGSGDGSSITSWVESHYTKTTVGGQTVYDLTKPKTTG